MNILPCCVCWTVFVKFYFGTHILINTMFFGHLFCTGIRQSHEHTFQCPYHFYAGNSRLKLHFFSQACSKKKVFCQAILRVLNHCIKVIFFYIQNGSHGKNFWLMILYVKMCADFFYCLHILYMINMQFKVLQV